MIILELKKVSVRFEDNLVLEDIDLTISQGESFVILGPSGQGKSVLLKTLAGLINPTSGKAFVMSHCWADLRGAERLSVLKKLGMLFQKNALFDSLSCSENIAFPLRETTALSEAEIQDRVDFFLEAVAIPHAKNLFPDEISGGMQKRLGIARALALEPEIIFYDDPTAGLDPITSRKIIDLVLNLQKKNKSTVVAITNDINRAYQMAHRVGMVVDRKLILTGTPEETRHHADPRVQQFVTGSLNGPLTALS